MNIFIRILISTLIITTLFSGQSFAQKEKQEFNAGNMIMEHILDAHDWHILTWGEKEISIPLPVILLYDGKIHCFMSSKFHHGEAIYNGFKLQTSGDDKGSIICVDEKGDPTGEKPWDFSITKNVVALFFAAALIIFILWRTRKMCIKYKNNAPVGLQSLMEMLVLFIRDDIARSAIGEKKYEKYLPFLLTLFFFILINNALGLIPIIPGGANITGNIAVTAVLALCTFLVTTFSGNKHYWKDIVNTPGVPWWLKFPLPLMPLVELTSVFTKPFVLMIRLFANMTAGHIIILGFMSVIFIFGNISTTLGYGVSVFSVLFSLFISLLEILVAFIQAYVFTLLSAIYIGMAMHNPEEEHASKNL